MCHYIFRHIQHLHLISTEKRSWFFTTRATTIEKCSPSQRLLSFDSFCAFIHFFTLKRTWLVMVRTLTFSYSMSLLSRFFWFFNFIRLHVAYMWNFSVLGYRCWFLPTYPSTHLLNKLTNTKSMSWWKREHICCAGLKTGHYSGSRG